MTESCNNFCWLQIETELFYDALLEGEDNKRTLQEMLNYQEVIHAEVDCKKCKKRQPCQIKEYLMNGREYVVTRFNRDLETKIFSKKHEFENNNNRFTRRRISLQVVLVLQAYR